MLTLARSLGAVAAIMMFVGVEAISAADLSFVRRVLFDVPYTASIVDLDGDGRLELPGLINAGDRFRSRSPGALGTGPMFAALSTLRNTTTTHFTFIRASRDTRAADLDNDGLPDLVNNVYWCNGDPENTTQLYLQNTDGTFRRSAPFDLLTPIRGRGETIVAADFDNDGFLDIYIPQYTRPDYFVESLTECMAFVPTTTPAQSWLLMNNGAAAPGTFRNVPRTPVMLTAADCGSDCLNSGTVFEPYAQPEGAQAIDYDEDGKIDLFVNGIMFRNHGKAIFQRIFPAPGVLPPFDEGLKFLDWNNDGYPDFAYVEPYLGTVHLLTWSGGMRDASGRVIAGQFVEVFNRTVVGAFVDNPAPGSYGMAAGDVNADGYEDVIVNGSVLDLQPKIFLNSGPPMYAFRRASIDGLSGLRALRNGPAIGDLNFDGVADVLMTGAFGNRTMFAYFNTTPRVPTQMLIVEVFGDAGGRPVRNQQGRVVHITPISAPPGFSYTRYVDGGSGYMAQGPYAVSVSTPFGGVHEIRVRLAGGTIACSVAPPAYVLVSEHGAPSCTVLPPPPATPIPNGHEMRALQMAIEVLLE